MINVMFVLNMEEIYNDILCKKSKLLVAAYSEDLKPDFMNDIIQLKIILKHFAEEK